MSARPLSVLVLAAMIGPVLAIGQEPGAQDPLTDPDREAVWNELIAAGAPPTSAELQDVTDRADDDATWSGEHGWRVGWSDAGYDARSRLDVSLPHLYLAGRLRLSVADAPRGGGAVAAHVKGFGVWAGGVGMGHGFGLLSSRPGRTASLSAEHTLLGVGRGPALWTGDLDTQAMRGAVVGLSGRRVALHAFGGVSGAAGVAIRGVRLGASTRAGNADLLLVAAGATRGASLAGRVGAGALALAFEAAGWGDDAGVDGRGTVVALRWRCHRLLGLECVVGATDVPSPDLPVRRPAVLSGWDGTGQAWRIAAGTVSAVKVRFLARTADHRERGAELRLVRRRLLEAALSRRLGPDGTVAMRWRRKVEIERTWPESYPWLPSTATGGRHDDLASLRYTVERDATRWQVGLRSLERDGEPATRRRSLATVGIRRRSSGGFTLRATWTTAWGEDIDLVSAAVPFAGFVVPRHWGRWRDEILLGAEWARGALGVSLAVSRRTPTESGLPPARAAWLSGDLRW